MHPLLEKQHSLEKEATELLKHIVLPILEGCGEVAVEGSYAYKLLSYPDIDIGVTSPDVSKETYTALCLKWISHDSVSEFKTTKRTERALDAIRPKGYWLSPKIHFGENLWNVDLWFQKPEWFVDTSLHYKNKLLALDDEKRIVILSLKEELIQKKIYGVGKEFQSVDVYDAVLNSGAHTIEMLRAYKHSLSC